MLRKQLAEEKRSANNRLLRVYGVGLELRNGSRLMNSLGDVALRLFVASQVQLKVMSNSLSPLCKGSRSGCTCRAQD